MTNDNKKNNNNNKKTNDFQLGMEAVRATIHKGQRGVKLHVPRTAFCGHWPGAPALCPGILVGPCYEGKFVAEALFAGETVPTRLTSSSLMLHETRVAWRFGRAPHIVRKALHRRKCKANAKHANAFARATRMYEYLLDEAGVEDLEDACIVGLDGMGTNHVAGDVLMDARGLKARPTRLIFEKDADVALAERLALGLGDAVQFTGADPQLSTKAMVVRGSAAPTLEHVMLTPHNRLLPDEQKRRTVWLDLDYCGGPPEKNKNEHSPAFMMAVVANLSEKLRMVSVTMAKRNMAKGGFDACFPPPHGFRLHTTFDTNPRVVCKLYVRDDRVVRHLRIPGSWWVDADPAWKRETFDGVVVGEKHSDNATTTAYYDVYVPHDDATYVMRADAVAAYAGVQQKISIPRNIQTGSVEKNHWGLRTKSRAA